MKAKAAQQPLPALHNFLYSAAAASTAVCATNPIDVAKTRLQLQGEIVNGATGGQARPALYKGPIDCMWKTLRVEGLRGAQRGLSTAIIREAVLNFFRIGAFEPILKLYHPEPTPVPLWKKIAAGVTTGCTASLVSNPLDLLKTRMQAQAAGENAAVGHQHSFNGAIDGFRTAVKEGGVLGLWKGLSPSMLRLALGSSAQLASYSHIKEKMIHAGYADETGLHIFTSFASVIFGVTAMNPVDVIRTRLYNQPEEAAARLYRSGVDAAIKIAANEGVGAFFKGWMAHYFRGAPHVCLIFVILESLKKHRPLERIVGK